MTVTRAATVTASDRVTGRLGLELRLQLEVISKCDVNKILNTNFKLKY